MSSSHDETVLYKTSYFELGLKKKLRYLKKNTRKHDDAMRHVTHMKFWSKYNICPMSDGNHS